MAKRKREFDRIPDTELMVMQGIWDAAADGMEQVRAADLLEQKPDTVGTLKLPTVQTLLTRLTARGYVTVTKNGHTNLYSAAISESDYRRLAARDFIQNVCRESTSSLLTALVADGLVEDGDIEELRALLHPCDGEKK